VPPPKPVKAKPPRLVPATAEARAAAALAARASKPGAKGRGANRPEPEVRPLGVLPLSSQAKPRDAAPARHAVKPVRSLTPPRGTPKQQPARKGDERLTEEDLKYFEQRLLTERRRIMIEMGHIEQTVLKVNPRDAAGELGGYSFHMADAGTDSMEREKAFDIASKEGRLLLEIDEALRRLYNGTYGICEISGNPISRTRLDALPWARLSIDEQEKLEREKRLGRMVATDKE
jgi:DnaK suppressor protein